MSNAYSRAVLGIGFGALAIASMGFIAGEQLAQTEPAHVVLDGVSAKDFNKFVNPKRYKRRRDEELMFLLMAQQ